MISATKRGAFIAFEGCDRSGKSTQSRLLIKSLQNASKPVKHMVFPERSTNIGLVIDNYLTNKVELTDEAIHLLFAANRWELKNKILSLLKSGTTVIVDRYSYSGVVYSVAKGLPMKWCMSPENDLPRPDIVFYLKADVDSLLKRDNYGEERYEKREFQKIVSQIYEDIYEKEKEYWYQIDANQNENYIHSQIKDKVEEILREVQNDVKTINW